MRFYRLISNRIIHFLLVAMAAISVPVLAHNISVSGGQDWTYFGFHYSDISQASYKFYGSVDQWTKDRMYEGIGRWNAKTSKLVMNESSYANNYVKEDNNLSVRARYTCPYTSGQHCLNWDMQFNRVTMQSDEANGSPRWRTIGTFAHEIGHMVGLDHISSNTANLMYVPWNQRTVSYPGDGDMRGFNYIWP